MKHETDRNDVDHEDEVSVVDLIAILVRWRRLWLSITVAGTLIGIAIGVFGALRAHSAESKAVFTATTRAMLYDFPAETALALATSAASADLVAANLGAPAGDNYRNNARASIDANRLFLDISVSAGSARAAGEGAEAGMKALASLLESSARQRNRFIAEALDLQGRKLKAEASLTGIPAPTARLYVAAYAQSERIEAEAFRDSLGSIAEPQDEARAALDTLVRMRSSNERLALDAYATSFGGAQKELPREATAALAWEVSSMLDERAALYRALVPLPYAHLSIVNTSVAPEVGAPARSPLKTSLVAFFGSLIIGILAAFIVNALDRVRKDPEAMAKLKDAMKGR